MDAQKFLDERKVYKRFKDTKPMAKVAVETTAAKKGFGGRGNIYQSTKTGYREHLGLTVRSRWENDVLCVLKGWGIKYEYEPRIFPFPIKRGVKAYTPDIYLPATNEWIEIKGFMDNKSQTKIKRFKIHHPEEFARLTMIISKYSTTAKYFCEQLGVPNVIYFEDLSAGYRSKITAWETIK